MSRKILQSRYFGEHLSSMMRSDAFVLAFELVVMSRWSINNETTNLKFTRLLHATKK